MSEPVSDYFDLGDHTRPIATASSEAQLWFDRGLVWTYGFNHEEAIRCFRRALESDPACAMAHWGIAYALGPNYNKPWEFFDEADLGSTIEQVDAALAAAELHATEPVERALVGALRARYPAEPVADWSPWNSAYAEAMRAVHDAFPGDLDVAALYADALMNLTPWALWNVVTGEPAEGSRALEARTVLDHALGIHGGDRHPGVLHFYIHLMEMSAAPQEALRVADRLRGLVPDAGHLEHMPTHLDVLVGDYGRVVASNDSAIRADRRYAEARGPLGFYTLYRCHDLHFKAYGAMFLGQSRAALDAVDALEEAISAELLRVESPPMADWLEGFLTLRVHVLIRFGRWEELIALPLPDDPALLCSTTAMVHYGRAIAHAVLGDPAAADAERARFSEAVARVPETRTIFNNTCVDILAVAAAMLEGELAYRRGDVEEGLAALRRAIDLDDHLPYDEPWGWMQPTRHAYGALLLEQGRVEEAEAVYRADLGVDGSIPRCQQHPGNVWSLHGYHECLDRLGKTETAAVVAQQLHIAVARADVPIESSCFCRLDVGRETHEHHCH